MNLSEPVRVQVSHKVPIAAEGLVAALSRRSDFHVCLDDEDPSPVDVVVADYATALQLAIARVPTDADRHRRRARVLIVADSDRESEVRAALRAGIHGYVLLSCSLEEVIDGVVALSRGARYLCRSVANRMAESLGQHALTQRESEVLLLMVKGLSNKIIARELEIAPGTVKAHAKAMFWKLRVGTRLQAVAIAAERGLVSHPSERAFGDVVSRPGRTSAIPSAITHARNAADELTLLGVRRVEGFAEAISVAGAHRWAANL